MFTSTSKKQNNFCIPIELQKVLLELSKNGITPVLVGGCVRDYFLNQLSKDYDIELFGCNDIEKIQNILSSFGKVLLVGKSFGVFKLQLNSYEFDFSLPRLEQKIAIGHKGFEVSCDGFLSFEKASKRRDFTINSIGYDYIKKEFLDPHNGINDLEKKVLKHIDDKTFVEDALRVYRAVQFCARFSLKLHKTTFELCKKIVLKNELEELSIERIFEEFKKLLLKSKKPSIGFILLKELDILKYFSELKQNTNYENMLLSLDTFALNKELEDEKLALMFATICCNFQNDKKAYAQTFLSKLTNDKKLINEVLKIVINYDMATKKLEDKDIKLLATKINIKKLCTVAFACNQENKTNLKLIANLEQRAILLKVLTIPIKPLISGADLLNIGLIQSKEFANILEYAYMLQLEDEDLSKEGIIKKLCNKFLL